MLEPGLIEFGTNSETYSLLISYQTVTPFAGISSLLKLVKTTETSLVSSSSTGTTPLGLIISLRNISY